MSEPEFVMDWADWIKLTPAEQEAVRQQYERPGSEAMPGALGVEDQRRLLRSLSAPGILESRWVGPRMYKREVYGK